MTNASIMPQSGNAKWWAGGVAAFAATYVIDHLEKRHGVNFSEYGADPAIVKGLLEGSLCSFLVWVTPSHLVQLVTESIIFVKNALKQWRDAINNPPSKDTP